MSMTNTDKNPVRNGAVLGARLSMLALVLGIVSAAAVLLAGSGYRFQILTLGQGLQTIRWSATGALGGAVIAVISLVVLLTAGAKRGLSVAALALMVNAIVAGPPAYMYQQAQSLPRIHDVSTDTKDPPHFVAVAPLRKDARNSVDYKPETAAEQKHGYPDIIPIVLDVPPAQAFQRAERAAHEMGWEIVADSPGDLRIEATDTTRLFGFKDDIVIRIRPGPKGSVVDVRSLSRVGGSDFGVNAKRVRTVSRAIARG
jgi:uncharacterized protein (DUF1499 family)